MLASEKNNALNKLARSDALVERLARAGEIFVEWADMTVLGKETAWTLEDLADHMRANVAAAREKA